MKPWLKKIIITAVFIFIVAGAVIWYVFSAKFADTTGQKVDYTVDAIELIHEFQKNDRLANTKYAEKMLVVKGTISQVEAADTTVNIKFTDSLSGAYAIFAFQRQQMPIAKGLKEGDKVAIKGSCSGGTYSEILSTEYISFKRCVLSK